MLLFQLSSCLELVLSDLSNFKFVQQTWNQSDWTMLHGKKIPKRISIRYPSCLLPNPSCCN